MKKYFLYVLAISSITLFLILNQLRNDNFNYIFSQKLILKDTNYAEPSVNEISTRDFLRYQCKLRKRIGGLPQYIKQAKHDLWRIDGAWFICMDEFLKPEYNNCTVLSFGINLDYSFDQEIYDRFKCRIESFDPFIEADLFKNIRSSDPSYYKAYQLKVNEKWTFHRIGLVGDVLEEKYANRVGWMASLNTILRIRGLLNKTLDLVKIDIEGNEADVINNLDMDYACQFIKQLVFETHPPRLGDQPFRLLSKLEKCFRLFHRDTRFFQGDTYGPTGHMTEFQNPDEFKLQLKMFKTEIDLASYLFCYGELYFINENFINKQTQK